MPRFLVGHDDIRQWAAARGGNPMLMDVPDGTGSRTLLELTFGQHALNADGNEGPDRATGGYTLSSWEDWFAEFDRQELCIEVPEETPGALSTAFTFAPRSLAGA